VSRRSLVVKRPAPRIGTAMARLAPNTWPIFANASRLAGRNAGGRALILPSASASASTPAEGLKLALPFAPWRRSVGEERWSVVHSWFDEGLASLYEQSTDKDGRIWGLPNWRLPDLQRAIAAGELPSSKALFATGDRPFYDADPGTNYAHARYVCLWLQEHGLLRDFYHAFVAAAEEDPTGHATFAKIIGVTSTTKWDRQWGAWVLDLRWA